MPVNIIEGKNPFQSLLDNQPGIQQVPGSSTSFADTLREFISDVNSLQKESAFQTEQFIKGEPVDIHNVMIAAEKAKTSINLLLELRNKALDLYREVSRLQV